MFYETGILTISTNFFVKNDDGVAFYSELFSEANVCKDDAEI